MADKFQLKALITGVDQLSPKLQGIRKNIASLRKSIRQSGLADVSLVNVAAVAAPVVAATNAAVDFEAAMAGVKKVVDFDAPQQFKAMGDDIVAMSRRLPMAAKDIAGIVAAGGQSGIAKGELTRFAEDAVKMGVAFDLSAQDAGDMMAKWRTAFKMGQDDVVALADKVNLLGNSGPANAKKISDIVTRIGPLGEVAGVASGQIAALGATIAGMGIEEEIAATGIKNLMLALTAGGAATKSQRETLKALRMDAKQVAQGMQKDAQGTITRILTAISKVDKSKQASVLKELVGSESIGAIAPLLTNLDLLKTNFKRVGDASLYAGSMQKEFDGQAATTKNHLITFGNSIAAAGIAVGAILLPPLNDFLSVVAPVIDGAAAFAASNAWLVKGALAAGAGLVGLKVVTLGMVVALNVLSNVAKMNPLGILAMGAGFLIANWSTVGPFFARLWGGIKNAVGTAVDFIKTYLGWTPLGVVLNNWGPLTGFFGALWGRVADLAGAAWEGIKWAFLNLSPLGLIMQNWEPIVAYFQGLWEKVKSFVEPILAGAKAVSGAVSGAVGGALTGATAVLNGAGLPGQTVRAQGGAAANVQVNVNHAPPGTRVDVPQQQGAKVAVKQNVGRRGTPTSN